MDFKTKAQEGKSRQLEEGPCPGSRRPRSPAPRSSGVGLKGDHGCDAKESFGKPIRPGSRLFKGRRGERASSPPETSPRRRADASAADRIAANVSPTEPSDGQRGRRRAALRCLPGGQRGPPGAAEFVTEGKKKK